MKSRARSRVALSLLLLGVLTFTSIIQAGHLDLPIVNGPEKGKDLQIVISEHRISPCELEELKQRFGTFEEGRSYNLKINGHGTGLRPPSEAEWEQIAESAHFADEILLAQPGTPPSSVDNSATPWFPPIGNQGNEGSCTTWAVGYYTKTFQEAKEHNWNLTEAEWEGGYTGHPTPEYQNRTISPDFVYHLVNDGVDEGSSFLGAVNLVCNVGACSWEKMPYDPSDHSSWPSEEAWREAPLYRGNSSGFEVMSVQANITSLKNWLATEHLAVIAVDANKYDNFLPGMDHWTLDNYVVSALNHANTIVGYNDGYVYEEQGEWRSGAFKIANSWGEGGWEEVADGYYWISYECMKQRIGEVMFYRDRVGYNPNLVAVFNMDHCNRSECDTTVGLGNHSDPLAAKSFSSWIEGGDFPTSSNDVVFDVTELGDAVPTVYNQSFFLQVCDQAVLPPHSGTYYWYSDGTEHSWFRLGQTFDIPLTGATLNFWTYYEIEELFDWGYVEVHDLDLDEWFTLPGLMTVSTKPEFYNNPNCPSQFEPFTGYFIQGKWNAFTGFCGDMYREEMNLTQFAGHTIELYFTYWTDPYVLELGWYVDDIEIPEIGFFDDVESGFGNWTYNGWSITSPPPSPNGTVLSFSIEYYDSYSSETPKLESTSCDAPVNTTNLENVYADLALRIVGDICGDPAGGPDGDVDRYDFGVFADTYGSSEGDPSYNPLADLTDDDPEVPPSPPDGDVDRYDLGVFADNYGRSF